MLLNSHAFLTCERISGLHSGHKTVEKRKNMGFEGKNPKAVILEKDQDLAGLSPALAVRCVRVFRYEMPSLRYDNTLGPASAGAVFNVINPRPPQTELSPPFHLFDWL